MCFYAVFWYNIPFFTILYLLSIKYEPLIHYQERGPEMDEVTKAFLIVMFVFLFLFVGVAIAEVSESSSITCEQAIVCPEGCVNEGSSETSLDALLWVFVIVMAIMFFIVIFMIILGIK